VQSVLYCHYKILIADKSVRIFSMKKTFSLISILLFMVFSAAVFAQEYPYEEGSSSAPVEAPNSIGHPPSSSSKNSNRHHALTRVGVKFGVNHSYAQSATAVEGESVAVSGLGIEGLMAVSWDLPYQPVFIELESGYRNFFLTADDRLHAVVLGLSLHYRNRLSRTSLWKPGIKSYFELRIQDVSDLDTGEKAMEFGVFPAIGVSSLFEFSNFLIEPIFIINRLQSERSFFSFVFRTGFRF